VFPVRYELSLYILIIRYSVFKGLISFGIRNNYLISGSSLLFCLLVLIISVMKLTAVILGSCHSYKLHT
jgi:hypothetical protein